MKNMAIIMKNSKRIIFLFSLCGLLIGCSQEKKVGLANPASKNCIEKGGILKILKRGDGGEYGVCVFKDDRQCEEWAMFRGECPLGGVQITAIQKPPEIYCLIGGGTLLDDKKKCQLHSGKVCPTKDHFEGKCS